jgi:peptidoglycan/xylan/chitin deacetylase (PgdA/CDA1 family)
MLGLLFVVACACGLNLQETCTRGGLVSITIDDGPIPYTNEILDIAKKKDVKLTFHFTTTEARQGNIRSIYKRAADEGHDVGLRLSPKKKYAGMSAKDMNKDIDAQLKALGKLAGKDVKWARASAENAQKDQGREGDRTAEEIYKLLWKKKVYETRYAFCPDGLADPLVDFENLLAPHNAAHNSFIVLLHDQMESRRPLLADIIDIARDHGYEVVPLSECLKDYEPDETGENQKSSGNGVESLCFFLPLFILLFQWL